MMKQLGVFSALFLALTAFGQDRVKLNSISKIEVKGSTIEITGSRKANFTTFTMADPARLVIDVSEAVFDGVPKELKVNDGTVTSIKIASYGTEASAIARILIGFTRELETDITSDGTALVVKLPADGAVAAKRAEEERLAREKKDAEAKAAAEAARVAKEEQERQAQEAARLAKEEQERQAKQAEEARVAKLAAEKAEAERKAAEKAEAERQAKEAALAEKRRLEDEKKARAAAEAAERERVRLEKEAEAQRAREEKEAAARAAKEAAARKAQELADAKRREEEDREAKAAAEKAAREEKLAAEKAAREEKLAAEKAARDEKARQAKEAADRKAAELAQLKRIEAEARAEAEREKAERDAAKKEEARLAALDAKRRAEEERRIAEAKKRDEEAQRLAEKKRDEDAQRLAAKEAEKKRKQAELEAAAMRTPSPSELASAGKVARMTFVGFKQDEGIGRVFFRTSSPVHYRVGEDGDREVVLTLENTQIGLPNNQRIIDASFFDTAVSLVRPEEQGTGVKVFISLKRAVAYRASQTGNELTLEFERPE